MADWPFPTCDWPPPGDLVVDRPDGSSATHNVAIIDIGLGLTKTEVAPGRVLLDWAGIVLPAPAQLECVSTGPSGLLVTLDTPLDYTLLSIGVSTGLFVNQLGSDPSFQLSLLAASDVTPGSVLLGDQTLGSGIKRVDALGVGTLDISGGYYPVLRYDLSGDGFGAFHFDYTDGSSADVALNDGTCWIGEAGPPTIYKLQQISSNVAGIFNVANDSGLFLSNNGTGFAAGIVTPDEVLWDAGLIIAGVGFGVGGAPSGCSLGISGTYGGSDTLTVQGGIVVDAASGSGASLALGDLISGAPPGTVLYADSGGALAAESGFGFDGTTLTVPALALSGRPLGLAEGGTGSDLSGTGPGVVLQLTMGAPLTLAGTLPLEFGGLGTDASGFGGVPLIEGGLTSCLKYNLGATGPPTASDDSTAGYGVGSLWFF